MPDPFGSTPLDIRGAGDLMRAAVATRGRQGMCRRAGWSGTRARDRACSAGRRQTGGRPSSGSGSQQELLDIFEPLAPWSGRLPPAALSRSGPGWCWPTARPHVRRRRGCVGSRIALDPRWLRALTASIEQPARERTRHRPCPCRATRQDDPSLTRHLHLLPHGYSGVLEQRVHGSCHVCPVLDPYTGC